MNTRKGVRAVGIVAGGYVALWFVTHFVGVREVYHAAVATMPISPRDAYTDVPRRVKTATNGPIYFCRATAYAPFLVRADWGWHTGPLSGDGGSTLYLWFFGRTYRVRELDHWSS
jgi:hypothetical protein